MNFYLLFFLLIILIGSIVSYIYFMKEKKAQLKVINQGICPTCEQHTIVIVDQRSTGCGSPKLITFECKNCNYTDSFNLNSSENCGI
ncbi:MAG: hypothetical protein KU29_02225 [Sulfurovum sp. FS06-10]|nr:MAG: hypothetical protein KU29_02225 [Sulfurovum sp. FS06-10]